MTVTDNRDAIPDMAMAMDLGPELPAGPFDVPITPDAGLPIPRFRVYPAAGDPYDVQAYGCDLITFEETAAKHRWDRMGPADAPLRWTYFIAWAASRREGLIPPDLTWDTFKTTVRMVTDQTAATARPTPPGPGPG